MTMEQCRERLAMPKDRRPPTSDPRVDKDSICENMLSAERTHDRARKAQASAPSSR